MLNGIKNLINSKKAYMEATKLILENEELDDSIVLNEEPAEPEIKEDETIEVSTDEEPVEEPAEQPLPLPDEEEVPTNNDDNSDILTAEIDLTTNTQVDSLPIPPANASDAIVGDDFMNQAIDSGFGNEEEKPPVETTEDIMTEPVDDEAEKEAAEEAPMDEKKDLTDEDLMAMSLDEILDEMKDNKELNHEEESAHEDIMEDLVDDDKMEKDRESKEDEAKKVYESEDIMNMNMEAEPITEEISLGDTPTEEKPAEEPAEEAPADENNVTAAVKDKVEEISTEEPTAEPAEGTPAFASKEELMKKLSSVTKSLEDAKSLVMNVTK